MGTSTRLPGPKNGSWTAAKGRLRNWTPDATSRPINYSGMTNSAPRRSRLSTSERCETP